MFLTIWLSSLSVMSQRKGISGIIINGENKLPVNGATVVLKKPDDSSFIRKTVSNEEGRFEFLNISVGSYVISVNAVGYVANQTDVKNFSNAGIQPQNISLLPSAIVLQNIKVSAKKPVIENKTDRVVVNVGSFLTTAGSSALEVLEKAPGVDVDKDGKISLGGKDGVSVLIDDRPAYLKGTELANYLRNLPASAVEALEIMANPSAKYDAAGNSGIINIKLKKNRQKGFNGSITGSAMVSNVWRNNESLNLNVKKGKVNLFSTYSFSLYNVDRKLYINRTFRREDGKQIESIFDQQAAMRNHSVYHNLKAGLDFYANKNTIAGLVFTGYTGNKRQPSVSLTHLLNGAGELDSVLNAQTIERGRSENLSVNANLRHTFDSTGKAITVDLDYIVYDDSRHQEINTDYLLPDGGIQKPASSLRSSLPSLINIYSAKSDFTYPLRNGSKIEAGLKSSYVHADANAIYRKKVDDEYVNDNSKSNHFLYKEFIQAAYINWNGQWNKWGVQAGVRAEHTLSQGHQLGNEEVGDSSFEKKYLNLFPTAYISYRLNEKQNFGLNFGRRIERPNYQSLNPFLYFLDEYTYEAGNVYLKPEFTNRIEFTYSYNHVLNTGIGYSHTTDAIEEVLKQSSAKRITYQTVENIADRKQITFRAGTNISVRELWPLTIDAMLVNSLYKGRIAGGMLEASGWMFLIKANQSMSLGKGWSAEVGGMFRSKTIDGQMIINEMWKLDAAVQKSILKKKGSINFFVKDIFNSQNFKGAVAYEDIDVKLRSERMNRYVGFSIKYNFGKPIKNLHQHRSGGASEEQSRVKSDQ